MNDPNIEPVEVAHLTEVEIKDAQVIFTSVWKGLVDEYGLEKLRFPKRSSCSAERLVREKARIRPSS